MVQFVSQRVKDIFLGGTLVLVIVALLTFGRGGLVRLIGASPTWKSVSKSDTNMFLVECDYRVKLEKQDPTPLNIKNTVIFGQTSFWYPTLSFEDHLAFNYDNAIMKVQYDNKSVMEDSLAEKWPVAEIQSRCADGS